MDIRASQRSAPTSASAAGGGDAGVVDLTGNAWRGSPGPAPAAGGGMVLRRPPRRQRQSTWTTTPPPLAGRAVADPPHR
eukprot:9311637-Alexandrium_andersonii.AAC.1